MTHTYFNLLLARRARNLLLGNTNNAAWHRAPGEQEIKGMCVFFFSLVNAPPLVIYNSGDKQPTLKLSPLPGVRPIFCSARREKAFGWRTLV